VRVGNVIVNVDEGCMRASWGTVVSFQAIAQLPSAASVTEV